MGAAGAHWGRGADGHSPGAAALMSQGLLGAGRHRCFLAQFRTLAVPGVHALCAASWDTRAPTCAAGSFVLGQANTRLLEELHLFLNTGSIPPRLGNVLSPELDPFVFLGQGLWLELVCCKGLLSLHPCGSGF